VLPVAPLTVKGAPAFGAELPTPGDENKTGFAKAPPGVSLETEGENPGVVRLYGFGGGGGGVFSHI